MDAAKAKIMFLELALVASKKKESHGRKAAVISEIERELRVAEQLLDNLAEKRETSGSVLVRINRKIAQLRSVLTSMKEY